MINWKFYLNDMEIPEPQGFSDITLQINRDPDWHGIFFDASISSLGFYGDAADFLTEQKDAFGIAADVKFTAFGGCEGVYETQIIEGRLDFGTYKKTCGSNCIVFLNIEQASCLMTLRNRYDQKVDLGENTSLDGTGLENYNGLNFEMEIPAKSLRVTDEVTTEKTTIDDIKNDPDFLPSDFDDFNGYYTPGFEVLKNNSLGTFNYFEVKNITNSGANNFPPAGSGNFTAPITVGTATLIGSIKCGLNNAVFSNRFNANITARFDEATDSSIRLRLKLFRLPAGMDPDAIPTNNWIEVYSEEFFNEVGQGVDYNVDVDVINSVILTGIDQGDFFAWGINMFVNNLDNIPSFDITVKPGSFFKLEADALCEPSNADVSLVNEVLSRITESITDVCYKVKSDYYGRVDSQPYASAEDGCGALRVLTPGLFLRNASPANFFLSLKQAFEGLKNIDNIGMGLEPDEELSMGKEWLRIEPMEYFYKDEELLVCNSIPNAEFTLQAGDFVSVVKVGYKKWEIENINGLDEYNSNKEFRTSLKTVNKTLDITSELVAGGYAIEITRQQSFADSGGADTTYDNETFIICVLRTIYGFEVEQGNIDNAANFLDPPTALNWRLRPFYNLMRWFKSIANSYANLGNSSSKLFFTSGTGNYVATGELEDPDLCKLENGPKAENQDLGLSDFQDLAKGTPVFKLENIKFTYPLSLADYDSLKANPYGYITFQCGNGPEVKGYITKIVYKPTDGVAEFNLKISWQ